MEIIEERLKRNCESGVTKYSVLYHKKVGSKPDKPNGLIEKETKPTLNMPHKRFPIFQQMKKENDVYLNGTVQYAYAPITMVLIEQKNGENKPAVMENRVADMALVKQERQKCERIRMNDDGFKWPGVHEVMEAYHKYAKGEF